MVYLYGLMLLGAGALAQRACRLNEAACPVLDLLCILGGVVYEKCLSGGNEIESLLVGFRYKCEAVVASFHKLVGGNRCFSFQFYSNKSSLRRCLMLFFLAFK